MVVIDCMPCLNVPGLLSGESVNLEQLKVKCGTVEFVQVLCQPFTLYYSILCTVHCMRTHMYGTILVQCCVCQQSTHCSCLKNAGT